MDKKRKKAKPPEAKSAPAGSDPTLLPGRGRRWGFRLVAAVGVPLALLLATEGVLRLCGYGYSPHFFLRRQIEDRSVWTDNQEFGRRFFPPTLIRYPRPFTFPAVKSAGTLRIFVLGESAAMGDPDVKFGLPRMLEVLLRERYPDRKIEVINAAMVAINSHVILPIARDCAARQGDLWVVYMGNNEVIGPFGSASVFGARSPALPLVRTGVWARTSRIGQGLDASLQVLPWGREARPEWAGMEMMAGQSVRHDAAEAVRVHEHFARNLADVLETGAGAGVPIVLCTVATNLKDCAPFASLHGAGLAASELAKWQAAYETGVAALGSNDVAGAQSAFEQAASIDDQFAELAYRLGECSRRLGQDSEAAKFFRQARDLDALQFRADGQINETIRRAATASAGERISLLDAEVLLATNSPHGLIGAEFFYEHVHLTPEGNYLLARAVAEQSAKALGLETSREWVGESECLRLLGHTDWNRYDALEVIVDRMQGAPFTNQVDHGVQLQKAKEQLARYRFSSKPVQVKRDLQRVSLLVRQHPKDADLVWNLAVLLEADGDLAGAEQQWRALVRMQPQAALPRINLGRLVDRLGRHTEALPLYAEGLRINPDYYPARYGAGLLCLKLNRLPEAIHHLELAVRQKPGAVETRLALGDALARANRRGKAQEQFRQILRLDPQNARAREQLARLQQPN